MNAEEFKKVFEADKAAGLHDRKQKDIEAAEDAEMEAFGAEIDAHPIISPEWIIRLRGEG